MYFYSSSVSVLNLNICDVPYIDKGDGEVILLLHGLFYNLSNFQTTIDYFSDKYRVIAPSLPLVDLPLKETNIMGLVHCLEDFVKHLGLQKFTLVGNSLGGHVAIKYVLRNSNQVEALVLTGSSGLFDKNSNPHEYPKRKSYEYISNKVKMAFYDPIHATKELTEEIFHSLSDHSKALRILSLAKSTIRSNLSDQLPSIHMPVLLIWGEDDQITPPSIAKSFKNLLPDAQLVWIKRCGHIAMVECPTVFNELLEDFLRSLKKVT